MTEGVPRSFLDNFDRVLELHENGHPKIGVVKEVLSGELRRANAIRHAGLVATPAVGDRYVLIVYVPDERVPIEILNTRQIKTGAELGMELEKIAMESEERLKLLRGEVDGEQDISTLEYK